MSAPPLTGLRVLEYGDFICAPYAAKLLADLGADVIKVEPPRTGDRSRHFGPFPGDAPDIETSGLHLYTNANKLGVTLDVTKASGARLLRALAREVDVVVENAEPGFLDAAGLDYESLRLENPRFIMTSLRPFGLEGPYRGFRGYDLTVWHAASLGYGFLGDPDKKPLWGAWHFASHMAGNNAAAATILAMQAREQTGLGQRIDISESDCLALLIAGEPRVSVFMQSGQTLKRDGRFHPNGAPSALLQCSDGFVFIHAYDGHMWDGLVKSMGSPEWASSPLFSEGYNTRGMYQQELYDLMAPWLMSHTKQEIFEICQANRAPAAPLKTMADLLTDEHFNYRGLFREEQHPLVGTLKVPGVPYRLTRSPGSIRRRAPMLGEHNEAVYCGMLGLSHSELTALERSDVV